MIEYLCGLHCLSQVAGHLFSEFLLVLQCKIEYLVRVPSSMGLALSIPTEYFSSDPGFMQVMAVRCIATMSL